jgi:hypothetical protein
MKPKELSSEHADQEPGVSRLKNDCTQMSYAFPGYFRVFPSRNSWEPWYCPWDPSLSEQSGFMRNSSAVPLVASACQRNELSHLWRSSYWCIAAGLSWVRCRVCKWDGRHASLGACTWPNFLWADWQGINLHKRHFLREKRTWLHTYLVHYTFVAQIKV